MHYRVVVNTMGPVQAFDFFCDRNQPENSEEGLVFLARDGVKHVFTELNVVRIAYYPIQDPAKGKS